MKVTNLNTLLVLGTLLIQTSPSWAMLKRNGPDRDGNAKRQNTRLNSFSLTKTNPDDDQDNNEGTPLTTEEDQLIAAPESGSPIISKIPEEIHLKITEMLSARDLVVRYGAINHETHQFLPTAIRSIKSFKIRRNANVDQTLAYLLGGPNLDFNYVEPSLQHLNTSEVTLNGAQVQFLGLHFPKLENLSLGGNIPITQTLRFFGRGRDQNNHYLKKLHVTKVMNVEAIVYISTHFSRLTELDIEYITLRGATALGQHLRPISSLTTLHLSNTELGDAKLAALASCLRSMPGLTTLDLSYNNLGDAGIIALAPHLSSIPSLTTLDLSNNDIGEAGIIALAPRLSSIPNLTTLDLSNNILRDAAIIALAPHLSSIPSLTTLDLSNNDIGDAGLIALASHLSSIPNLTTLDLSYNNMGDAGLIALAQNLSSIPNLTRLDLSNNNLGNAGATALGQHLKDIPSLKELDLSWNSLEYAGIAALAPHLSSIPSLTTLDLSNNDIGEAGIIALAPHLSSIPNLTKLSLNTTNLEDGGLMALLPYLSTIPYLTGLDLRGIVFGEEAKAALRNFKQAHPKITISYP